MLYWLYFYVGHAGNSPAIEAAGNRWKPWSTSLSLLRCLGIGRSGWRRESCMIPYIRSTFLEEQDFLHPPQRHLGKKAATTRCRWRAYSNKLEWCKPLCVGGAALKPCQHAAQRRVAASSQNYQNLPGPQRLHWQCGAASKM